MRQYPERPVAGVGAVVFDAAGRVLLVKRRHAPLKGEWSLPGGAVELGETLATAVAREVLEETSLVVDVGPVVEVIDRVHHHPDGRVEYHYIVIDYVCRVNDRADGTASAGSDADDVRWVAMDELSTLGVQQAAIAVIHKAFGQVGS